MNGRLSYLLGQYLNRQITEPELHELSALLLEYEDNTAFHEAVETHIRESAPAEEVSPEDWDAVYRKIIQPPVRRIPSLRRWWAAAAAVLLLAGGTYLWTSRQEKRAGLAQHAPTDIAPGKQGAILTLADGSQLVLDSLHNGAVATQGGTHVLLQNGQLRYMDMQHNTALLYNTMQTPRGRQFQLLLPDGTRVWLNAASSIRYPTAFSGNTREVTVTGEAYFEVAKDASRRFIVHANNSAVEVLGTHFNVNAYDDETDICVTLLEGKVNVGFPENAVILQPGQQARFPAKSAAADRIQVLPVDVEPVVAWKDGVFNFQHSSLPSAMRQIARWYDVDVVYEKNIPDIEFGGKVQRNLSLSQIIEGLSDEDVHFRIEGRKLIVMP